MTALKLPAKRSSSAKPAKELSVRVQKGKSSVITKEAIVSNAERYRDAMIRLANR